MGSLLRAIIAGLRRGYDNPPGGRVMVEVLKWGAMGLGLAGLAYTAELLRQELKRREPRREARYQILTFMLFSLALFCIGTFLELRKESGQIAEIVSSMDAHLGDKFADAIKNRHYDTLVDFTDELCIDVRKVPSHCASLI
jgi:hypothetical protein